jgi:hypothetical protein
MSKQITRRPSKQNRRQERREEQLRREAEQKKAAQTRRLTIIGIIIAAVLVIGGFAAYAVYANNQKPTPTIANPLYPPVGGVYCDKQEQTAFHIHAHVTMYINGKQSQIPQGIGIASDQSCLYWLHGHDTTGVIHIEAPSGDSFVLRNFLNEWSSQFSSLGYPSELDLSGWTAYVGGKLYNGDFQKIPLQSHSVITLMYNSPNAKPDNSYDWNAAGLGQ